MTELTELAEIRAAVDEVYKRMPANSSHAAIHISGGGALAVVVGLIAIVCLIAAVAIAWVGWQQTLMTQQEIQRLREASDMHQALILRTQGQVEKLRVEQGP